MASGAVSLFSRALHCTELALRGLELRAFAWEIVTGPNPLCSVCTLQSALTHCHSRSQSATEAGAL